MKRLFFFLTSILLLFTFVPARSAAQSPAEFRELFDIPKDWPREAVRSSHGMVATDEPLASQAGVEILKCGGNAVDAAVATAFVLAVVEPAAGNIGGGGFMLVRLANGKTTFFDYRETAPAKATRDMYIKPDGKLDEDASTIGYRSVAIPGTVAGLALALKTHGTMKLADVMQPAIRLAEQGFPVSEKLARELTEERPGLQRFSMSSRIFLNGGKLFHTGDTLRQPELAATLKRIARNGPAEFYQGETAQMLARDMAALGGLITLDDLAHYQPKIREALHASYTTDAHRWEVFSAPPPSSGGVAIIEALNMLQDVPLNGWDDPQSVHFVVEVMRRIFADRAAYLADPDFANVPVAGLTDPCYARELLATIDPRRASSSKSVHAGNPHVCNQALSTGRRFANGPREGTASAVPKSAVNSGILTPEEHGLEAQGLYESGPDPTPQTIVSLGEGPHTTHFSVVDAAGNAVASTTTLNDSYGSHVTTSAGFLLNDEMDDFTTQPGVPNALFGLIQSEANAIGPGKRPLSSMTPTILVRNGQPSFVTGSPGGPTIISVTLLSILNWMRLGMDAQSAINAPRFHHQWLPDEIQMEKVFSPEMEEQMKSRGHTVKRRGQIGLVNAIGIDARTGERCGAADPRDAGSAVGY
ncbi:MAG TPA: gamma-glutamyltransferase family protein [Candidatus Acidoferrum sp.]|nr:gamma-glutamyltransferase family protein [Candidatus Acidoferrum sp.]